MLKKELRDILNPTLGRLSFLLIIPLLALLKIPVWKTYHFLSISLLRILNSYTDHVYINGFLLLLAFIILWTANYYGSNAFRGEHRDRAFEYLLAFPYSRGRILLYKLVPRVTILSVLTVCYEMAAFYYIAPIRPLAGPAFFLIDPLFFPAWVLFFFLAGFFTGLFEQKNWTVVVTFTTFVATLMISLGTCRWFLKWLEPGIEKETYFTALGFLMGTVIILVILGIGFFRVYRGFDMKSPALHARRFAMVVLPPMGMLTVMGIYFLIVGM